MANIREHVAWVVKDTEAATARPSGWFVGCGAVALRARIVCAQEPVTAHYGSSWRRIAGIQAALTIADAGYKVYLVEREPAAWLGRRRLGVLDTHATCSRILAIAKYTGSAPLRHAFWKVTSCIRACRRRRPPGSGPGP